LVTYDCETGEFFHKIRPLEFSKSEAGNLFWLGRYVDRAANIARLADAARRIEAMPGEGPLRSSEWASALIAGGVLKESDDVTNVSRATAVHTLFFDNDNPSSVVSCMSLARENARSVRVDLSQEVWEAINDAWLGFPALITSESQPDLERIINEIKGSSARIRGSINESLLYNDGYHFIKFGQAIERIDSMARLVDVKYNVLLGNPLDVGNPTDRTQWQALLQASAAQRAYSYVTKSDVSARGVAQFLLLSGEFPRSILFNARSLIATLNALESYYGFESSCRKEVVTFVNWVENCNIDSIISHGLHEMLTEVIEKNYQVADVFGQSYGFSIAGDQTATANEELQSQN